MRRVTILAVVVVLAWSAPVGAADPPALGPGAILRALEDAFAAVADRVTPAVVHVGTVPRPGRRGATPEELERFHEFFGDELFERFFRQHREAERATGSGVIVDPNGYILTNNHVIENARDIVVRLSDQRKFTATLVGRDPKTDLAVLKIDAPAPLPAAELGDSDRLRVGQWAIAIGNPFGLDRTVTVGIVSATARTGLGVTTYESFIQTDASINPGNSGGPLLDLDGRVIGINTAIVSAGQGIGFSIPINMARDILRQLIDRGRVVRGWLGIAIQDVRGELAQSFGVADLHGVLIADVLEGGPAERAGLRRGDLVVEFDGAPVREVPELQRRAAAAAPGRTVTMVVLRDGQRLPVPVTLGEMPGEEIAAATPGEMQERWGLTVEPLGRDPSGRPELMARHGVVVTAVAPDTPAGKAGLAPGDVIISIKGKPVTDPETLERLLAELGPGDGAPVYVHRPAAEGGRNLYVVLERPAER